jgi:hypothetical protein
MHDEVTIAAVRQAAKQVVTQETGAQLAQRHGDEVVIFARGHERGSAFA